jgi:hypothetical protein
LFIIISDLILAKKMITLFPEVSNQKREKKIYSRFFNPKQFFQICLYLC